MVSPGTTILVVDDDEEFRSAITEVLLKEGFRVAGAANGAFALHVLSSVTPDLILLDLAMPMMNGRQLLAVLATDPRLSAVPIAVLSGAVTSFDAVSTHRVLRKPIQLSTLLELVHELVGERGPWRGKH